MGFFNYLKKLFGCASNKQKRERRRSPKSEAPVPAPERSLAAGIRERMKLASDEPKRRLQERLNFSRLSTRNPTEYSYISSSWMSEYNRYLTGFASVQGPISNRDLYAGDKLKTGLREGKDYLAIPKTLYDYLHERYQGDEGISGQSKDIYKEHSMKANRLPSQAADLSRPSVPQAKARAFPKRPPIDHISDNEAEPVQRVLVTNPKANLAELKKRPADDRSNSKLEGGIDASLPPYRPTFEARGTKEEANRVIKPRTAAGFYNPSNYCFMNSALQCLFSVPPFADYFLSKAYTQDAVKRTPLSEALSHTAEVYFRGKGVVRPEGLWSLCHKKFPGGRQHDLPEFLRYLLEVLEKELKRLDSVGTTWDECEKFYNPMLLTTFCGQTVQNVTCMKCKHDSKSYEIFSDIALDLKPSVKMSMAEYTKAETIDTDYKCENCRKITGIIKETKFLRLPNFLILQIKRFESYPTPRKADNSISFDELMTVELESGRETLKLIAVAVHSGSLGGGHYVAYGFRDRSWYSFNDSSCSPVSAAQVMQAQAYLLVYMKA
jgi:ubiquitin C-terminal hydrolase